MKPIYSNNKKAPRLGKAKFARHVVTRDCWKEFRESNSEYEDIPWEVFYKYWKEIAETIRTETVTNPLGVKLGAYTGELKVQYTPHKMEKVVDRKTSAELGEKVKFTNLVTRGKVATVKWERRWAVRMNRMLQFFAFTPTRELTNLAGKHIKENPDKVRTSRNTLGGYSVWRQLRKKK